MKTTTMILTTLLLALALPSPASAWISKPEPGTVTCPESSSGWGWETAECQFVCVADEYIHVHATVDNDAGASVTGDADCGGVTATCTNAGSTFHCDGVSSSKTSSTDLEGVCSAEGYGGNGATVWTQVTVDCEANDNSAAMTMQPTVVITPIGPIEVNFLTGATIRIVDGEAVGAVCRDGICVAAAPTCTLTTEFFRCRLG